MYKTGLSYGDIRSLTFSKNVPYKIRSSRVLQPKIDKKMDINKKMSIQLEKMNHQH